MAPASHPELGLRVSSLNADGLPQVLEPLGDRRLAGGQLAGQRALLGAALAASGAVLLRGFPVPDAAAFRDVLISLELGELQRYRGAGVRHEVIELVYTASDARDGLAIPLHQELSYTRRPPAFVSFYCETAPPVGTGHTLLGRATTITEALPADVISFFAGREVDYISCFPRARGPLLERANPAHKTWVEAFGTDDRRVVERLCEQDERRFEWARDWLITTDRSVTFRDGLWHNQIHVHKMTPRLLQGWRDYALYRLLYLRPGTMMMDAKMADGAAIPRNLIDSVIGVLAANTIEFDWMQGDVLILDNLRVMHGRSPVSGDRRILAAMIA